MRNATQRADAHRGTEAEPEGFDLNGLVDRCLGTHSKRFVGEAVSIYRLGAFRSCVVATWVAVVYDIVEKLLNLSVIGDARAGQLIEQLEDARRRDDPLAAMRFESGLLEIAQNEFEFITPIQREALERLKLDRNRCAHPAFNQLDEPFVPSKAAALAHIEHAVEYVLSQPPVQGRAALDHLMSDVNSRYFPTTPPSARSWLEETPLAKAKETLVRNFIVCLLKAILLDGLSDKGEKQHMAALHSAIAMYPESSSILKRDMPRIVQKTSDERLIKVVRLCARIPEVTTHLGNGQLTRLRKYVENATSDELSEVIRFSLGVAELGKQTRKAIQRLSLADLIAKVSSSSNEMLDDEIIRRYAQVDSFVAANKIAAQALVKVSPRLNRDQVAGIRDAFVANPQVRNSIQGPKVIAAILLNPDSRVANRRPDWLAFVEALSAYVGSEEAIEAASLVGTHFGIALASPRNDAEG